MDNVIQHMNPIAHCNASLLDSSVRNREQSSVVLFITIRSSCGRATRGRRDAFEIRFSRLPTLQYSRELRMVEQQQGGHEPAAIVVSRELHGATLTGLSGSAVELRMLAAADAESIRGPAQLR